jgi:homoserine acetyltransferase
LRLNKFAKDDFLNDQDEQTKEIWWEKMQTWKFSQAAFETPISVTLQDLTIPSTYVILENDMAFVTQAQEMITNAHTATKVIRINSGHCVFLSHEASIVEIFDQVAQEVALE